MSLTASFEQEGAVLEALQAIHPGPWACAGCEEQLTPATGWKPRVAFVVASSDSGVYRSIVDVYCGECAADNIPEA